MLSDRRPSIWLHLMYRIWLGSQRTDITQSNSDSCCGNIAANTYIYAANRTYPLCKCLAAIKTVQLLQHVSTSWQQAEAHPELQNLNLHAPCLDPTLLCLEVHNVFRICLRIVKDSKDGCSKSLRKDSSSLTCDCISAFWGQSQSRPTNPQPP